MKQLTSTVFLLVSFFFLLSCKNSDDAANIAPTNLAIQTEVSTDGSGTVVFKATATNADYFTFEFGDGKVQNSISGSPTYTYTTEGTFTYTVTVTAKSASGLTLKKSIDVLVSVTVKQVGPVLFWSEEFNTDGAPDPTKWGYDLGNNNGWGNGELEYYTNRPSNAYVQGGVLKIVAIKESYSGFAYTSARLLSKDKFAFMYGKVEIKAKLPVGIGTWPALWMLGSDISSVSWPACGEIDIMEHLGRDLNRIYGTLHYPGHSGGTAVGNSKLIANATTEFHLYSLDWSASAIKIYVDDVLFHTVANSSAIPFNHNFFFILNVAMGGGWPGAVDPAFTSATMEVDYIRVYK